MISTEKTEAYNVELLGIIAYKSDASSIDLQYNRVPGEKLQSRHVFLNKGVKVPSAYLNNIKGQ